MIHDIHHNNDLIFFYIFQSGEATATALEHQLSSVERKLDDLLQAMDDQAVANAKIPPQSTGGEQNEDGSFERS